MPGLEKRWVALLRVLNCREVGLLHFLTLRALSIPGPCQHAFSKAQPIKAGIEKS
jgi:hypothetical protein